jgi:hypothetical protein
MRIRIPWLPLWMGLVGGSLCAVASWLPPSPQLSSDRAARAGPPAGWPLPAWPYRWC